MKRLIVLAVLFFPAMSWSADKYESIRTNNGQLINRRYPDMGSGFYGMPAQNIVSMSSYTITTAATNSIKASAGYLESIILNTQCANSTVTYVVADAAAAAATYAKVISTFSINATPTIPGIYPYKTQFFSGLSVNTFSSTCPVTVIWQ